MDELILKTILAKKDIHPLLYRLYELGRFARFFTAEGIMKAVIAELSTHVADNASSAHASSQLSLEGKLYRMKTDKIKLMREKLDAAKQLLKSKPELAGTISCLENELARMIIEDTQPEEKKHGNVNFMTRIANFFKRHQD